MRLPVRVRALAPDRMTQALVAVLVCAGAFYLWRASLAVPLALHGSQATPYNQLADAFLHFHLWVAHVPPGLLGPPPSPQLHQILEELYPDYSQLGRNIYITWGPAPVLVLLVPLHLLGFEPSGSVIITPFVIAGLGFALATLRRVVRQITGVPRWACVFAALTLAFSSAVTFLIRAPQVYDEAVAGGYCFAMAGIWLAVSAIAEQRASLRRVALMSLCFGLAAGSRPTLGVVALVLVPVYKSLRSTQPHRRLLVALAAPVGTCLLLLALYDQARFGNPLQYGLSYQLNNGGDWGAIGYIPPGLWSYLITPPRIGILFPFLSLIYPQASYPLELPAHYFQISEETGGLLTMTPIALFAVALPWSWRSRPALLGRLAAPLLVMEGVAVLVLLFLCYEFFGTTDRYEVDYTTLLLFGAVAAWLALASATRGRRRRLVRWGGGLLAVWSCLTGVAIGFQSLQQNTGTSRTLADLGSPVSSAIASLVGHPVLAEVDATHVISDSPSYGNLGTEATGFWLGVGDQAQLTIVSPDSRDVELAADVSAGPELRVGAQLGARVRGPGRTTRSYQLPTRGSSVEIPVHVSRGLNRIVLSPIASESSVVRAESQPEAQVLMAVTDLHLAGS